MALPDPDWQWEQAQKHEKTLSWFAAAFHCREVLKSRPTDTAAKTLLTRAEAKWKKQQ